MEPRCLRIAAALLLANLALAQRAAGRTEEPQPRIISCYADVRGGLSREAIQRVFRLRRNEIRGCYQAGLRRSPTLNGRIAVRLRIDESGVAHDVAMNDSTLADARVEQCVLDRVRRFEFPSVANSGPTLVTYGFKFEPRLRTRD